MTVPRFWREIPQRYNLQASQCGYCQQIHYPPRAICPMCRRLSIGKMQTVRLSGRAKVVEATRIHRPAHGYERQVPYILALVETEEGPVLTAQVVETTEIPPPGTLLKAVFRRLGEDGPAGVIHYGTKWALLEPPATNEEEE